MNQTQTTAYATLILRLSLGTMFIAHALLKWLVFTLPGTAQFFESLGLPGAGAYLIFSAELIGGSLLLLGVQTRWVAALLMPILLGATWAHASNGWVFSAENGGWEYPLFLALATIVLMMLGDGAMALKPGITRKQPT